MGWGKATRKWVVPVLAAVLAPCFAMAQNEDAASIQGSLTDANRQPVTGAQLILRNDATGLQTIENTDENGTFAFPLLGSGSYTLEAKAADGLSRDTRRLEVGLGDELDVPLELTGGRQESSNGDLPRYGPEHNPDALPDASGRWSDRLLLETSATAYAGDDDSVDLQTQLLHLGLSGTHTEVKVDGMDATVAFQQQERGRSMGHASLFPGAVQDMSFSEAKAGINMARTGLHSSSVSSMSGTRELHGQVFLNDRQNTLAAANAYTQVPVLTVGTWSERRLNPAEQRLEWGFSAGGPVRHMERLHDAFWFVGYDGSWFHHPAVARVRNFDKFFASPTQQQMQELGARLNTTTGLATDKYNQTIQQLAAEELGAVNRYETAWSLFPRMDWRPRPQHQLTAELNLSSNVAPASVRNGRTEAYGTTSFGDRSATRDLALVRWQYQYRPRLIEQLTVQASSDEESEYHQQPNAFETEFLQNSWGLLPQVSVAPSYGLTLGKPATLDRRSFPGERQLQLQETVLWSHRKASFQFGFHYRYVSDNINHLENQTGSYDYASLVNYVSDLLTYQAYGWNNSNPLEQHGCGLTGLGLWPCYSWYRQNVGAALWTFSTADWAAFASGEWKLTPRLTVSAGLRYQYQQVPNQTARLVNPDIPGTYRMPHDGNNAAPSLGIAWSPFGENRMTVHAGLGLYYGRTTNAMLLAGLSQTGASGGQRSYFFRQYDAAAPPFPYVFAAAPTTSVKPSVLYFAPHFQNPEIEQFSLSIEQRLPWHNRVSVGSFLSMARELPKYVDTNIDTTAVQTVTYLVQGTGGPIPAGIYKGPFYTQRVNANYQQITEVQSETNLNYWSAQLRWEHTSRQGMDLHLLYTYAKSVDGNPNESSRIGTNDPLDLMNPRLEVGRSNFDQRHALSSSATLHMPRLRWKQLERMIGGMSAVPTFYWRSGLPYSMHTFGAVPLEHTISGTNIVGLAQGINGSGGDNRVPVVARNMFRGPDTYNAHARLSDRWKVRRNCRLIAEMEAYNLLNHQNVTRIDTNGYEITAPSSGASYPVLTWQSGANGKASFGQPYNSNSSVDYQERRLQFGLRLEF